MPSAKRSLEFAVVEGPPPFAVVEDSACVVEETPVVVVVDELHPDMTTTEVNTTAEKVSTASDLDRARLRCDKATASSPRLWLRSLRASALPEACAHTSHRVRRQSLGPDSAADLHHGSHSFLTCRLAGAANSGDYHDCGLCPGRLAARSLRLGLLQKLRFLPVILFSAQQIFLPELRQFHQGVRCRGGGRRRRRHGR